MKLLLKSFRGATQPFELEFKNSDRLTILFGENGTGKTTITDGFDFIFRGTAGSLAAKSLDGKSPFSSLPSLGVPSSQLLVSWEEEGQIRTCTLSNNKPVIGGEPLQSKLRALRRSDLAGLLEDTPANKYKHIQSFVELERLEGQEIALTALVKKLTTSQPGCRERAERAFAELKRLHEERTEQQDGDPISWARSVASPVSPAQMTAQAKWTALLAAISGLNETGSAFFESRQRLEQTSKVLQLTTETKDQLSKDYSAELADSLPLLEAARAFLGKHVATEVCPLCEQSKEGASLSAEIASKLETLSKLREAQKDVDRAALDYSHAERQLRTVRAKLSECLNALLQLHTCDHEALGATSLAGYVAAFAAMEPDEIEPAALAQEMESGFLELDELAQQASAFLNDFNTRESYRRALDSNLKTLDQATGELASLSHVIDQAEQTREVFRSSRVAFAEDSLRKVEHEIARLYSAIHPGEHLENIHLLMHPDRRGSLEIKGNAFSQTNIPPQAYYSESHLDTLALCIFIALEKEAGAGNTIFLIDDAITSVDEAHLGRLYDLLHEEAQHFKHVVITSHYQPLRHKWKWGRLTQSMSRLVELAPWTQEYGLSVHRGCENEINLLRRRIDEADDPSGIAGKSGIILEHLLDFLSGIYSWDLPRLTGPGRGWTLDQYLSRIPRRLLPVLKAEHFDDAGANLSREVEIGPLLTDIRTTFHTRNIIGAHYNELAAHFNSLAEALDLGRKTLALADALTSSSGELPTCRRNGTCWKIRGSENLRLHPLVAPN